MSPPITAGKRLPLSEAMALFQSLLNQQQEVFNFPLSLNHLNCILAKKN